MDGTFFIPIASRLFEPLETLDLNKLGNIRKISKFGHDTV